MPKAKLSLSEEAECIYRDMTNGARLVTRTRALDRFGPHALIRDGKAFRAVTGSQLQELRSAKRIAVAEPSESKYLLCYELVCPHELPRKRTPHSGVVGSDTRSRRSEVNLWR